MNSTKHADFLLADVNPDLINLCQMLSVVPEAFVIEESLMFGFLNTPDSI
ncbi:DNA adenine methylase [Tatumella ptyseos ATCC 33301]|uniref:DNA adenine methylase n=2 Tax=Tatumella ptyseos TaxID=82987 RepID=A0A085JD21_9GAMM|nr:DNA adenine methylase [Tatumella ptyseos ATCC 33301]SQK74435.1 Uncharacterised protein [Tatumella ptyseos]